MKRPVIALTLVLTFFTITADAQSNRFLQAYDSMHTVVSGSYPFTQWKGIKFDQVNATVRPKIVTAAAANDTLAYYTALQEYVNFFHDGHVNVRHGWELIRPRAIARTLAGSYGFTAIRLDDSRVVARLVNAGSPAAMAGMTLGAQILEINDRDVDEVLDTVPVLWSELVPATKEYLKINQGRFIGRAPLGSSMKVKFLNRGTTGPVTATLTAVDDAMATYNQTSMNFLDSGPYVRYHVIDPGDFGYIKLIRESGNDSADTKKIFTDFRAGINALNAAGVKGLVLDMRINAGGEDAISAAVSGLFYPDTALYEIMTYFDTGTGHLEVVPEPIPCYDPVTAEAIPDAGFPDGHLYIIPNPAVRFTKPVVVMVSPRSVSSGEGVPMALKKLPQCRIVSFWGTHGSFGFAGNRHSFFPPPDDGYKIYFPYGANMDSAMNIQVDSDSTMTGGVIPNIRVPLNDTVIDQLNDSIDVELNYALKVLGGMTGVEEKPGNYAGPVIQQIRPNPCTASTGISYYLPSASRVTIEVVDVGGRVVCTLSEGLKQSGPHNVTWNTHGIAPGLYVCRLTSSGQRCSARIIVK